jgi:hypothetical protein
MMVSIYNPSTLKPEAGCEFKARLNSRLHSETIGVGWQLSDRTPAYLSSKRPWVQSPTPLENKKMFTVKRS